jgi:hypothetical protein
MLFLIVLHRAAAIKDHLMLVKPEAVLFWQRSLIERLWKCERPQA